MITTPIRHDRGRSVSLAQAGPRLTETSCRLVMVLVGAVAWLALVAHGASGLRLAACAAVSGVVAVALTVAARTQKDLQAGRPVPAWAVVVSWAVILLAVIGMVALVVASYVDPEMIA